MFKKQGKLTLFSLSLLSLLSAGVNAETANQHIVVAPQCLMQHLSTTHKTLSSVKDFSLIEVNDTGIRQLAAAKSERKATPCGGFVDVTADWQAYVAKNRSSAAYAKSFLIQFTAEPVTRTESKTYEIKYPEQVNQLIEKIDSDQMWNDLTTLSSFYNRNASTEDGVKAAEWFKTQVETLAKNSGHKDDVTVYYVTTGSYKQPSVVAKFGNSSEPGIVIGSHMDTTTWPWSTYGREPGADDDGSGSVTNLGIARTLLSSGMQFKKPIYFIWYAAEEAGLVGSSYVVKDFINKKIPVDAVLQFDMTGYSNSNDPTIWLINDNVNKDLTAYLETLVKTYVKKPVARTRCGYACSDHASWSKKGFTAAFPFEAAFGKDDPYIHSSDDVMDVLSRDHITDFAKLGTAFAVELAEPVK